MAEYWTPFCPLAGFEHNRLYAEYDFCGVCGKKNPKDRASRPSVTPAPQGHGATVTTQGPPRRGNSEAVVPSVTHVSGPVQAGLRAFPSLPAVSIVEAERQAAFDSCRHRAMPHAGSASVSARAAARAASSQPAHLARAAAAAAAKKSADRIFKYKATLYSQWVEEYEAEDWCEFEYEQAQVYTGWTDAFYESVFKDSGHSLLEFILSRSPHPAAQRPAEMVGCTGYFFMADFGPDNQPNLISQALSDASSLEEQWMKFESAKNHGKHIKIIVQQDRNFRPPPPIDSSPVPSPPKKTTNKKKLASTSGRATEPPPSGSKRHPKRHCSEQPQSKPLQSIEGSEGAGRVAMTDSEGVARTDSEDVARTDNESVAMTDSDRAKIKKEEGMTIAPPKPFNPAAVPEFIDMTHLDDDGFWNVDNTSDSQAEGQKENGTNGQQLADSVMAHLTAGSVGSKGCGG